MPFLAAGAVGSLAALFLVAFAPGNQERQVYFPPHPNLPELVSISIKQCWLLIHDLVLPISGKSLVEPPIANGFLLKGFSWIALLIIPVILTKTEFPQKSLSTNRNTQVKSYLLLILPLFTLLMLLASVVPAAYAMSNAMPSRTLIIPYFFVICIVAAWSYCVWNLVGRRISLEKFKIAFAALAILFTINVFRLDYLTYKRLPAFREYARYWDERDARIHAALQNGDGQATVSPPLENPYRLEDATPDSEYWTNKCLFYYYDVKVKSD